MRQRSALWIAALWAAACTAGGTAALSGDAGTSAASADAGLHMPKSDASSSEDDAAVSGSADAGDRSDGGTASQTDAGSGPSHDAQPTVHAAEGGMVIGESSAVSIPKGALSADTHITIEPGTSIASPDEWRYSSAGAPIQFGPSGTQFATPVTVTLTFDAAAVGGSHDRLVVAHRDDRTGSVQFVHPSSVHGDQISVEASSFSTFQPTLLTELMAGVLRDHDSQQPLAGGQVFFYGSGYGTATTDAHGAYSFTIETLTPFGGALSGTLYGGADGHFEAPSVAVSDLAAQPTLPVVNDFNLRPSSAPIQGVVTAAGSGMPIASATVSFTRNPMSTFRGGATTVSVNTATDGSYHIDASYFAQSDTDSYSANLMIDAPGFLGSSRSVTVASIPSIENFVLVSNTGPLMTGVVTDRDTHTPIASATVFFYGSGYGTVTTDATGHYAFTAADLSSFGGSLSGSLYVGSNGYFEAPSVSISDLSQQSALPVVNDVSLAPSGPIVSGVITESGSGTPLAGATIRFSRSPMSTFRGGATTVSVTSAQDGRYAIDASFFAENDAGSYGVNFMVDAQDHLGATRNITVSGAGHTENFSLPSSSGGLLSGIVRDRSTNDPIAGAQVFFYGSGYGTVTADANGAYLFTAADISSFGGGLSGTLYVGKSGYFEAPPVSVSDLSQQPSLPVVNDVTLLASGPLVTGTVTDASNSTPIANAAVSFSRSPMSTFRGGATTVSVNTANDGRYSIDASYFAESQAHSYSINLMINASGYLGATRNVSISSIPETEDFALTPGTTH